MVQCACTATFPVVFLKYMVYYFFKWIKYRWAELAIFLKQVKWNRVWDLLRIIQPGGNGGGAWTSKQTVQHLGNGLNWWRSYWVRCSECQWVVFLRRVNEWKWLKIIVRCGLDILCKYRSLEVVYMLMALRVSSVPWHFYPRTSGYICLQSRETSWLFGPMSEVWPMSVPLPLIKWNEDNPKCLLCDSTH